MSGVDGKSHSHCDRAPKCSISSFRAGVNASHSMIMGEIKGLDGENTEIKDRQGRLPI